ncbi:hypothetical protein [Pseudonocardia sp. GCM10023141]|uniref:hypothetical protein n=1 Tax=Pseudonocardia sp. GCM10023141 TaxID=3252653 RepID=UPI003605EDBF
MTAALGRGVATGALAGAIAGPLSLVAYAVLGALLAPTPRFGLPAPDVAAVARGVNGVLSALTLTVFLGALAGVVLGVLVGLVIGLLGPRLGRRPRLTGAVLSGASVLVLGAAFTALGMATDAAVWFTIPPLPVAVAVGAWRGRYLVHGRPEISPAG